MPGAMMPKASTVVEVVLPPGPLVVPVPGFGFPPGSPLPFPGSGSSPPGPIVDPVGDGAEVVVVVVAG